MQSFMNRDFLLANQTARVLFHEYADKMPIADYHCHVSPREIAEDIRFDNLTQAWLGGDHYKWRLIRSNGMEERYITGDAGDREKFQAYAESLPRAIGNPLYHWTHLELQRYFGCGLPLTGGTAQEIWDICNRKLREADLSVRGLIKRSHVTTLCTTDDPADSLEWHAIMRKDPSWDVKVLPSFRPDKAINIDQAGFAGYLKVLGKAAGMEIRSIDDLFAALANRMDFFDAMGCRSADHGMDYVPWQDGAAAGSILQKALEGEAPAPWESDCYKTIVLQFLAKEYARRGWVMQIHYGAQRNINPVMMRALGPDSGFDCISTRDCSENIARFLGSLCGENILPKTILYSLNPSDNAMLGSVLGCFQGPGARGKVQHGSAWWFNDTKTGMTDQITTLASLGVLGNFVGMLTDSRSFLSYTRHEYFRRILCNLIGTWVENGEYPDDIDQLGRLVNDISYNNTVEYFGF